MYAKHLIAVEDHDRGYQLWKFFQKSNVRLRSYNGRLAIRILFTLFFIGLGICFTKQQEGELHGIKETLSNARPFWLLAGVSFTLLYIASQGYMYKLSFDTVGAKITVWEAVVLFLKRNFISVFLPAGGVTSLLFFNEELVSKGIPSEKTRLASVLYALIGVFSTVIVSVPTGAWALLEGTVATGWIRLSAAGLLLVFLTVVSLLSFARKGALYRFVLKRFPHLEVFVGDAKSHGITKKKLLRITCCSIFIDLIGILHVYIAICALQVGPSLAAAAIAYVVSVFFLMVSPFLRGLGAVEVSMGFVLVRLGFPAVEAVSITLLYRVFEFWLPMLAGVMAFLLKIGRLLMRVVPALLLFGLGIIDIISVLTPAIRNRLETLEQFLPTTAIHASDYLVLASGLFLLITAAFMLRGSRTAWWFAVVLSVLSLIGNITKAIDFEESGVALLVFCTLMATRKDYYVRADRHRGILGIQTALLSTVAVLAYGVTGFYFLDKKHFGIDFSLPQSVKYTLENYFLLGSSDLHPADPFALHFLASIEISGLLSMVFLAFSLVTPFMAQKSVITAKQREIVSRLLERYGNSALDYFKTYFDKLLFISKGESAFISYRLVGNFALVLEGPVAAGIPEMGDCIKEFDRFCFDSGLKSVYYRVPEHKLDIYGPMAKKHFFIGQEAVVDLQTFSLEGGGKKSLRNALKKIGDLGLKGVVHQPPLEERLLRQLKAVSDEWLAQNGHGELLFSQGVFSSRELKNQTVITVENNEAKIFAFLNVIPDYAPHEGTYDLIRKTNDAPNGIIDFMLVELFQYLKSRGTTLVNLGLAPMSGIDTARTIQEKSMKYAYEKVRSFSHYKGLRDFKQKFGPTWHNQYLVFTDDYDLIRIPRLLSKAIKP